MSGDPSELELFYRFQTLQEYYFSSRVHSRKQINSSIITRKRYVHFKQKMFSIVIR